MRNGACPQFEYLWTARADPRPLYRLWSHQFKRSTCTGCRVRSRLRVVPHFSSGTVERAKRERAWKSPRARKGLIFLSPRRVSPFLAWGDFHARSRFARPTIPEEKWGTTRSLCSISQLCKTIDTWTESTCIETTCNETSFYRKDRYLKKWKMYYMLHSKTRCSAHANTFLKLLDYLYY